MENNPNYLLANFRKILNRISDVNGYCRNCNKRFHSHKEASAHCKETLHTVDVYTEKHTTYTCYRKVV